MMYASKEEEKGRVRRGRGKEREEENTWAYGKGWPWTTSSIARAYHVLPMLAATKRREGCEGKEEREGRRGRHGHMVRYGREQLRVLLGLTARAILLSLGPAMPYPYTPCRRPPLKRPHGRFRGARPQGEQPAAVLLPL
jgi:hypothetical protein